MVYDKSNKSLIEISTDVFLSCLCSSLHTTVHTRLVPRARGVRCLKRLSHSSHHKSMEANNRSHLTPY